MEENPIVAVVEPPRGFHQARVDEKGRLKLPSVFQQYLNELGEKKVFITTLDVRTVRLYPLSVWKVNEKLFEDAGDDAEFADDVAMVAQHFGGDSEVDSQGRVLVPQELRQELKIEGQPVWLGNEKGVIAVYSESVYQDRLGGAKSRIGTALGTMKKRGLR